MKFKGLLIAVVLLAALGGGVYWSEKAKTAEEKAPAKDAPPKILTIADDQFKAIRLQRMGGDTTVVQKSDAGKWAIAEPKPLAADQDAVGSMVSTLASLTSDRLIEDKATDLSQYGLASPALEVTVTKKDGKTENVLIGDDTPTGGSAFVKLKSDPRIFSVASSVKQGLDKNSQDLRDKRLLTFDSEKLKGVALQAKGSAIEFGKNSQNEWQIVKPQPLRADGSQVDELVRKLKEAKMDTSVSEEDANKAASTFASGVKVGTVNVTDASGTQTLEVRKDKDKNYYAKSSILKGIYKSTAELGDGLDKELAAFRNKKLFDFGFSDPTKVTVNSTTYEKSAEKWMSAGKQMDSPSVQAIVDKLRDLSAASFPATGSGETILDLAVSSNDGKRTEKVTIQKQGAGYIAKRDGESSIYQLDAKTVDELQKTFSEVKSFSPPKSEEKKK